MKRTHCIASLAAILGSLLATACASAPPSATRFDSAEQAVEELVAALRAGDLEKAAAILGSGAADVLHSGDAVADGAGTAKFLAAYDQKHHLVPAAEGGMDLLVGDSDWPLPIPVVEEDGRWSFDTEAGLDELLSRRIGRNELNVVQVCLAIVDAQREYAAADRDGDGLQEYAEKFASDEGKRNGLFWPANAGEPQSPLGSQVAEAKASGYSRSGAKSGEPIPYHGYYFRILAAQGPSAAGGAFDYVVNGQMIGGFAVVAWPAEYANSGIMTFLVNHAGVVYEKDLGDMTAETAAAITTFSPGAGWAPVP